MKHSLIILTAATALTIIPYNIATSANRGPINGPDCPTPAPAPTDPETTTTEHRTPPETTTTEHGDIGDPPLPPP